MIFLNLYRTGERERKKSESHQNSADGAKDDEKTEEPLYEVKISDNMGRYLVATRDIERATVLFDEEPLVVGPSQDSQPLCLGCYQSIDDVRTCKRCSKCEWPICSLECTGLHKLNGHTTEECETLVKCPHPTTQDLLLNKVYNAIVPLRCLLLKEHNPEKWKVLQTLEAHDEIRKKLPYVWKTNQTYVSDRIRKIWGLEQYTEDEIHTICGYLEVNAFEVGQGGISIRALYPNVFLVAHDCIPNTSHVDNIDYRLIVRASTQIMKGELITLSYANTLQGTVKRREHLKASKFFDCICERCSDPTEKGTYMSALICPKCENGLILPTQPLDDTAIWQCTGCSQYTVTQQNVEKLVERIQMDLESIGMDSIDGLEMFLKKYEKVLHPNHYTAIAAKHSLSQLYGKAPGYLIHELTETQLERKRDICFDLLKVFDIIEPGFSRPRGVVMYELHAPIMILMTRKFETKSIQKKDVKVELKKVVNYLNESKNILSFETENSMERIMAHAAIEALERIKDWEKIIGKL